MRTGDGFLCVYSVTLQASFDEAVNLHEHILRVKDAEEVPFVLVGNKCDLEDAREVKTEKGQGIFILFYFYNILLEMILWSVFLNSCDAILTQMIQPSFNFILFKLLIDVGLANDLNCPFLEASAKTRYNVDESFTTLVKEIQKFMLKDKPTAAADNGTAEVKKDKEGTRRSRSCVVF